jgi:hypothetical protein
MTLYHHTTGDRLDAILADGWLRPARCGIVDSGRPVVWMTTRPSWEPSTNKMLAAFAFGQRVAVPLTEAETHHACDGLVRITIDDQVQAMDWDTFKRTSGTSAADARFLYSRALAAGTSVRHWMATYDEVPVTQFAAVEFWNGHDWQADRPAIPQPTEAELAELVQAKVEAGRAIAIHA